MPKLTPVPVKKVIHFDIYLFKQYILKKAFDTQQLIDALINIKPKGKRDTQILLIKMLYVIATAHDHDQKKLLTYIKTKKPHMGNLLEKTLQLSFPQRPITFTDVANCDQLTIRHIFLGPKIATLASNASMNVYVSEWFQSFIKILYREVGNISERGLSRLNGTFTEKVKSIISNIDIEISDIELHDYVSENLILPILIDLSYLNAEESTLDYCVKQLDEAIALIKAVKTLSNAINSRPTNCRFFMIRAADHLRDLNLSVEQVCEKINQCTSNINYYNQPFSLFRTPPEQVVLPHTPAASSSSAL